MYRACFPKRISIESRLVEYRAGGALRYLGGGGGGAHTLVIKIKKYP